MTAKKIIQRNLPLNESYKITGFSYAPILDGDCIGCDNCGKLISNRVHIENSKGQKFTIGNDCAETLTVNLKNSAELFLSVNPAFAEGKQTRSKLLKHLKTGNINYWYLWTAKDGKKYIVGSIKNGGSTMFEIFYPEITLQYVKDILIDKPTD